MMMRKPRMTSSSCDACSSLGLFPFWCLDDKWGEDSYLYCFFILVCIGQVVHVVVVIWTRTYLCVACKTLMACITLLWILCYLSMCGCLLCLSILYVNEMIFVVVPRYSCHVCNLVPILIITLSCHLITHILLGNPRFVKLYKRALSFLLV
jgi:hypothetical protein